MISRLRGTDNGRMFRNSEKALTKTNPINSPCHLRMTPPSEKGMKKMKGPTTMPTSKQSSLLQVFLSSLDDQARPLYEALAGTLQDLGYQPKKEKSNISFKHGLHNKQMAKMGVKATRAKGPSPFFSLRFSACRGYSQRFESIISAYAAQYPAREARCTRGECSFCQGDAATHVYNYEAPDGQSKTHCGAYAIDIPALTAEDLDELKTLIREEHAYLMEHEAGIPAEQAACTKAAR